MAKHVLIFDFDGTLVDSMPLEFKAMIDTLHEYGHPEVNEGNLENYFGPTEKGILDHIIDDEDVMPEAWIYFLEEYVTLQDSLLFSLKGMSSLLEELSKKQDLLLLLITGRSRETLDISLEKLGYDKYFAKCYAGSDDGVFKKENIQNVIDDYQVDKEEILYIGDTVSDIQNMKELGVSILSAAYCHKKEEEKKALEQLNPNRVAHSVEELKEMIYKEI